MRHLHIFILFAALSLNAVADSIDDRVLYDCNASVRRMYHGCRLLTHGVHAEDPFEVSLAVDSLNANIIVPGESFTVSPLVVTPLDTVSNEKITDCFKFTPSYGIKWMEEHGVVPFLEAPSLMRDIPGKCKILTFRLAPHGSAVYSIKQKGRCKWFVFYEPSTDVGVEIESVETEIDPEHFEDVFMWHADWIMPHKDNVHVTFTNRGAQPSTIILISN